MKRIAVLYVLLLGCSLLCLIYIGTSFHLERQQAEPEDRVMQLTGWTSYESQMEDPATTGKAMHFVNKLPEIYGKETVAFYTIHQNVEVLVNGTPVYRMEAGTSNRFGKSPGCVWNLFPLTEEFSGGIIEVILTSPYEAAYGVEPVFFFGDRYLIVKEMVTREFPAMITALFTILAGILLIGYWIHINRHSEIDASIFFLGLFAVMMGTWVINDLSCVILLLDSALVLSYLSYIALMAMPIPFVLFLKELYHSENRLYFNALCGISIGDFALCTLFQITGIADFRETLILTHCVLGLVIFVTFIVTISEIKNQGITRRMKLNIICIILNIMALVFDMVLYYILKGNAGIKLGGISFLIYVLVLGFNSVRETAELIEKGRLAVRYQQLAYYDPLTGLYSRNAYEETLAKADVKEACYTVVMFDLNNLKLCNDTKGHEAGDQYLQNSAGLLKQAFEELGSCFRIGGDEFCAILQDQPMESCTDAMDQLEILMQKFNSGAAVQEIHIACGYAVFDAELDQSLNDTVARADAMMYRKKSEMKGKG